MLDQPSSDDKIALTDIQGGLWLWVCQLLTEIFSIHAFMHKNLT